MVSSLGGECPMIHIGQAGCQVGHATWELFCLEHGIYPSGQIICSNPCSPDANSFNTFFNEQLSGTYVPRAIFVDMEPTVIDEVRVGAYRSLFDPGMLISGKEDAANNFARGYYTLGHEFIEVTLDRTRRLVEQCNSLQGFFLVRALGGGTGSGFAAYLIEKLQTYYGKKTKISLDVFPSPRISTAVVEPYNALLTTHSTMDNTDVTFIYDNEALYNICARGLGNYRPTYTNLNRIIAQVISGMTAALRFDGSVNVKLVEFQTNLVPFPRIHFPLITYGPLICPEKGYHERITTNMMISSVFDLNNQMVMCNVLEGKYIAVSLLFRGDVTPNDVNTTLGILKGNVGNGRLPFVDWVPTGFKVGLCYRPPTYVPGGDLAATPRAVVGMMNTTAIRQPWRQLLRKFNIMYKKRAFVHWYVGEGMEESEFSDARNDMMALYESYEELNKGGATGTPMANNNDFTVYGKNILGQTTAGPATKRKGR